MGQLTGEQRARLQGSIAEHGLQQVGPQIESAARATVHLIPIEQDDYRRTGASRFGGLPDLPEGIPWPTTRDVYALRGGDPAQWDKDYYEEDDLYLGFLAQINLRHLPKPAADPLPEEGMLYFFLGSDELEASDLTHLVLWHTGDEAQLRRTPHPDPERSVSLSFQEIPNFTPYRIAAEPGISLPHYGTGEFNSLGLQTSDGPDLSEAYFALQDALASRNVGARGGESQLLGYPFATDDLPTPYRQPELLFQIDSDSRIGMRWWDAGLVHFLIEQEDLNHRRFSHTYAGIYTS